jgi:transcriptional regulator with XRE-family HTH domain
MFGGADVKDFRQRHKLTQLRLAYLMDVTPGAISKWEREGDGRPPPRWVELALKGLEVELAEKDAQPRTSR